MIGKRVTARDAYFEACGALGWGFDPVGHTQARLPDAAIALVEEIGRLRRNEAALVEALEAVCALEWEGNIYGDACAVGAAEAFGKATSALNKVRGGL